MKNFKTLMVMAAAIVLALPVGAFAQQTAGKVTDAWGAVRVVRARDGAKQSVRTFSRIFEGDQIETGKDGRVKILMVDDSVLSLAPNSAMKITEMMFNAKKQERGGFLSLLRGKIRAVVAKYSSAVKSKYQIATPTAVAGIRGTTVSLGTGLGGLNDFLALESGAADFCLGSNCVQIPEGTLAQISGGQISQTGLTPQLLQQFVGNAAFSSEGGDYGDDDAGGFGGDEGAGAGGGRRVRLHRKGVPLNTDERNIFLQQILNSQVLRVRLDFPNPNGGGQ